ncbi:hypothetical protein AGABI1DRAFT_111655 [Agaricus bisporus var. burnettii JB137-S8]|uniref:DUF6699 domain-containing protein n=1 Tax=Agaricus bisporus var. burnettii (strain JB137-S8 / ATCC MYA-4627 / FGSC 10392) TaxID=597362 RepID=K5XI68_AGABU|nr:uncharacterized protein AGABI1DRAFT_111655 [Agaricus bisporus var. burnettii JB137-S8]EKM83168.1 hypothetical protein AGABI1DRAFT_111655 [Agaricus bisporus var. burnettii JB137-S8]
MSTNINKWAPGESYGPVLSQTDLYLLKTDLEINPIFAQKFGGYHLVLDLTTGVARDADGRNSEFNAKMQPAVLPRVEQLYVISETSPWCTTVRNPAGVTMSDVCQTVWSEYTNNAITDAEMGELPQRLKDQIKGTAQRNQQPAGYGMYTPGGVRCRRVDWLRDRHFFEGLRKDEAYAKRRLGFSAPNVFIMDLNSYY